MKPYPKYRDSGVEWIREIPEEWGVKKLKFIAIVRMSNVDKKSSEDEEEVLLCNYIDVYKNDLITSKINFMKATATKEQIRKFSIRKGDVIITKDSETAEDIAVPALVNDNLDGVICGYHLAHIRPNTNVILGKYLYRLFLSKKFNGQFTVAANGVTRFGLSSYSILNAFINLPQVHEQEKISLFLDRETSRIDNLIKKYEKTIELLNEKRISLISHVVTKGLNPDVKMNDSGIKWIGEIPGHWELKRLRFFCKTSPSKTELNGQPRNLKVTFLPMENISENGEITIEIEKEIDEVINGYTYFRENDVLVAKITPCFENGKGAIAKGLKNQIGFGTTEIFILRPAHSITSNFLYLITVTHQFRKVCENFMKGAAGQKRVPEQFIKDFRIAIPDKREQQQISEHLDQETAKIDRLIEKINKQIELLQEHKTSLISHAVTGKIDVRGLS